MWGVVFSRWRNSSSAIFSRWQEHIIINHTHLWYFLWYMIKKFPGGVGGSPTDTILYHLVDMNTPILLVESKVILNSITGFKSKNILKCAFKTKTCKVQCSWCIDVCVYQRRALKRVIRSHITCLITVMRKILIKHNNLVVLLYKCGKFVTEKLYI